MITTNAISDETARYIRTPFSSILRSVSLSIIIFALLFGIALPVPQASAGSGVEVWWPAPGAEMSGVQPFKAMLSGRSVHDYEMYWQVGDGQLNPMWNSFTDYPHKEASVDLSGWHWSRSGDYTITFVAKEKSGAVIGRTSISMVTNRPASAPVVVESSSQPAAKVAAASTLSLATSVSVPISAGGALYVNPNSNAARQARDWRSSRSQDAALMDVLAAQPQASWFGDWNGNLYEDVRSTVSAASASGKTAVLVAYNIPHRDCGSYSAGGARSDQYLSWIGSMASGIGSASAIVILEPDALASTGCLSQAAKDERMNLLSSAVDILKKNGNTKVYLDAGHAGWISASDMAASLRRANVARADGFALNVSNFGATQDETVYGAQISERLGGTHFVIDTSRNGNGGNGQWCNPWGRHIGQKPTLSTGHGLIDAYLWIKTPGESDGACNGGPSAGHWWPDYALGLVR